MAIDRFQVQRIANAVRRAGSIDARRKTLERECGDDLALRELVEAELRDNQPQTTQASATNTPRESQPIDNTFVLKTQASSVEIDGGRDEFKPASGVLLKRYLIGDEIARGGMGVVLRATDQLFMRDVAVKVLLSRENAHDAERRFRHEAEITAALQHPGIPPVHDLGSLDDGRSFMIMKLIQGTTLSQLIREREDFSADLQYWVSVFGQVAQTVGFAHNRNVIHRDLKPQNIMVGEFGEVQVMDWGLAKRIGEVEPAAESIALQTMSSEAMTQQGVVMGTLEYMAPEQAQGASDSLDARADVFALGAILSEILTGSAPYKGESAAVIWQRAAAADLSDTRAALSRCESKDLAELALQCLAKDPADRPPNGEAVAEAISNYQAAVESRLRESEAERARMETEQAELKKRRLVQFALGASIAILVVGILGFLRWQGYVQDQAKLNETRHKMEIAEEALARQIAEAEVTQRRAQNRNQLLAVLDRLEKSLLGEDLIQGKELLSQAQARIGQPGAEDLAERFESLHHDFVLLDDIVNAENLSWIVSDGRFADKTVIADRWSQVFARADIISDAAPVSQLASRFERSRIKERLLGGLEAWYAADSANEHLRDLITHLDPDPIRNKFREQRTAQLGVDDAKQLSQQPVWFVAAYVRDADFSATDVRDKLIDDAYLKNPGHFSTLMTLGTAGDLSNHEDAQIRAGWCRAAIAARPESSAAWNNLGVALNAIGDTDGALAACQRSVSISPDLAISQNNLGVCWKSQGNFPRAIECFEQALALDANNLSALLNIASAYHSNSQKEKAFKAAEKAIQIDPASSKAHITLGLLQASNAKTRHLAFATRQHAVELDPNSYEARTHLGLAYAAKKEWKDAIEQYQLSLELNPASANTHHNLAIALQRNSQLKEAIESAEKAVQFAPAESNSIFLLGELFKEVKQYEKSEAAMRQATELSPDNGAYLFGHALTLHLLQRYDEAAVQAEKATQLLNRPARAYFLLGGCYFADRDFKRAKKAFEKTVELEPKKYRAQIQKLFKNILD